MSLTPNFGLGLPDEADTVAAEFYKLQTTIAAIDAALKTVSDSLGTKSAIGHTHTMSQITGLVAALAAKQDAGQSFKLDDLSDVSGASAAANGYILVKTALGFVAQSALSALGGHGHAIADITGLAAALADGATTTLKLADGAVTPAKMADALFPIGTARRVAPGASTIQDGVLKLDPKYTEFIINTEANASIDDLTNIVQLDGSDFPQSADILLKIASSGRDVVAKHAANTNAGYLACRAAMDITLNTAWTYLHAVKTNSAAWICDRFSSASSTDLAALQAEERAALGLPALFDAKADATAVTTALSGKADTSALTSGLALKANLASPAFTGNPTAPTQAAGNNSTRLATTAFVQTALSGVEAGIGYGQSWQTVTRTSGTSYQNTTGKPIMVSVSSQRSATASTLICYVGAATAPTQIAARAGFGTGSVIEDEGNVSFIVPPNFFYRITSYIAITVRELR